MSHCRLHLERLSLCFSELLSYSYDFSHTDDTPMPVSGTNNLPLTALMMQTAWHRWLWGHASTCRQRKFSQHSIYVSVPAAGFLTSQKPHRAFCEQFFSVSNWAVASSQGAWLYFDCFQPTSWAYGVPASPGGLNQDIMGSLKIAKTAGIGRND